MNEWGECATNMSSSEASESVLDTDVSCRYGTKAGTKKDSSRKDEVSRPEAALLFSAGLDVLFFS